jgi:hypothetical protein
MFCQTAAGGSSKPLVRGAAPSTPPVFALRASPGQAAARPRRKERRRLTELMFFRCTSEDRTVIEANAARTGLEKSAYMRVQSTGKPVMRAYRRVRADWDELRRCMGVINRAGNVVNQLVVELRRMGSGSGLANAALAELGAAAHAIVAALRAL